MIGVLCIKGIKFFILRMCVTSWIRDIHSNEVKNRCSYERDYMIKKTGRINTDVVEFVFQNGVCLGGNLLLGLELADKGRSE